MTYPENFVAPEIRIDRPWCRVHPVRAGDAAAVSALRAAVASLKGKFEGSAGRGRFVGDEEVLLDGGVHDSLNSVPGPVDQWPTVTPPKKGQPVMKIASKIARYLAGLIFLVFGLNGFLHFIPQPPMGAVAGQFMGALYVSHYLLVIFAVQLVAGVLLLANRYVPLAVAILAPVIFNILCFHAFMAPSGLPLALFVAVLWTLIFVEVRPKFAGLFQSRTHAQA